LPVVAPQPLGGATRGERQAVPTRFRSPQEAPLPPMPASRPVTFGTLEELPTSTSIGVQGERQRRCQRESRRRSPQRATLRDRGAGTPDERTQLWASTNTIVRCVRASAAVTPYAT
jgi:hypothetical protein